MACLDAFWRGFIKSAENKDPLQSWLAEAEDSSSLAVQPKKDYTRRVDPADQGEMSTTDAFYRY